MPKVSVVMAAYNHGEYIPAALASALSQTMDDIEIHVIDDGSTDSTPLAVEPFLADGRVFYHRQANAGQASAKNLGIARSRGEFVAFLDADDEWLPDKLERQLPLFEDQSVGVVYSGRTLMDPAGNPVPGKPRPMHRGMVLDKLFVDNFVCFSSSVARRGLFAGHGVFDESLRVCIDYDLWLRFARHCRFDCVDAPLVKYRTGHVQLSNNAMERIGTAFSVMDRHAAHPGARALIGDAALREAYAMTHNTAAYILNGQGLGFEAAGHALKSICQTPFQAMPYRQILKAAVNGLGQAFRRTRPPAKEAGAATGRAAPGRAGRS